MDVPLTPLGCQQAKHAGRIMQQHGMDFDLCFTSVLARATHTAWHCLDAMDRTWLPTVRSWRLNERHYGALHGLKKADVIRQFGAAQVQRWRRSYATRPPPGGPEECDHFRTDERYADVLVPASESMADTVSRLRPFWIHDVRPALNVGGRILVVAHGTSLRALIKLISGMGTGAMTSLEIPNGVPMVTEVDGAGHARPPQPLYD